jgi:hypothetical protein
MGSKSEPWTLSKIDFLHKARPRSRFLWSDQNLKRQRFLWSDQNLTEGDRISQNLNLTAGRAICRFLQVRRASRPRSRRIS